MYSFFTLFVCVVIAFSMLTIAISIFRNGFKLNIDITNGILVLTIVLSILFIIFGTGSGKIPEVNMDNKTIKLVEWNVTNNINKSNIQEIFGEFDADIAVFPELKKKKKGDKSNKRLADLFKKANIDFDKYEAYISEPSEGNISPVTVVIKKDFGEYSIYKETPMTRSGTVYLSSKDKTKPPIIGLHTAPPLIGLMSIWERDLNLIADISCDNKESIIIGDFNATMKHGCLNNIKTHLDVLEYAFKK